MIEQHDIVVETSGRGCYDITTKLENAVESSSCSNGLCHVFLRHTSASLIISENADPAVMVDIEMYLARLIKDGDDAYTHTAEGPDDMSAHLRSILTQTELMIPVRDGKLALGVWQGVYLYEHRYKDHTRKLIVSVQH